MGTGAQVISAGDRENLCRGRERVKVFCVFCWVLFSLFTHCFWSCLATPEVAPTYLVCQGKTKWRASHASFVALFWASHLFYGICASLVNIRNFSEQDELVSRKLGKSHPFCPGKRNSVHLPPPLKKGRLPRLPKRKNSCIVVN